MFFIAVLNYVVYEIAVLNVYITVIFNPKGGTIIVNQ